MNEQEMRNALLSWEFIPQVIQHISENPELCKILMKIARDDSEQKNWRAMYLIDQLHDKHPELVIPLLPELIAFLKITQNSSKKRHLLKLISANDLPETELVPLMDLCIDQFANASEPIAVRVHAMQILYNIAQKETGFANELAELIRYEIEFHGSAGIRSRGRKLLAKLEQISGK